MSGWAAKRFWKTASVQEAEDGFTVTLDGRGIKTPAKTTLIVPTQGLAQAIAAEWDAQDDTVKPATMPFTRTANAAIDKVALQRAEVAEMLAAYGDADLLCYRAEAPQELVQRQADAWDPALDWAERELAARLATRAGVMHAPQDAASLKALSEQVHALNSFQLAGFHDLVAISGSLVLGLAAARDWKPAYDIWMLSRIDDLWQEERWGRDEDAHEQAMFKWHEFQHAKSFYDLC